MPCTRAPHRCPRPRGRKGLRAAPAAGAEGRLLRGRNEDETSSGLAVPGDSELDGAAKAQAPGGNAAPCAGGSQPRVSGALLRSRASRRRGAATSSGRRVAPARARVCVCARARHLQRNVCGRERRQEPGTSGAHATSCALCRPCATSAERLPHELLHMAGLRQRRGVLAVDHVDRLEVTGLYCGQPTLVRACAHARRLWHALEPAPSEPRWRARTHMGVGAPR